MSVLEIARTTPPRGRGVGPDDGPGLAHGTARRRRPAGPEVSRRTGRRSGRRTTPVPRSADHGGPRLRSRRRALRRGNPQCRGGAQVARPQPRRDSGPLRARTSRRRTGRPRWPARWSSRRWAVGRPARGRARWSARWRTSRGCRPRATGDGSCPPAVRPRRSLLVRPAAEADRRAREGREREARVDPHRPSTPAGARAHGARSRRPWRSRSRWSEGPWPG